MRIRLGISLFIAGCIMTSTATAQWVSFDDETAGRLSLQAFADAPSDDPLNDEAEKDMAVADLNKDGWQDVVVVRKLPFSNPGARQDVLLMNENGTLVDRTGVLAPGFIATQTDARDVFIGEFTGDTWPDVVIANTFGNQPRFYRNAGEDGGGNWLGLVDESNRLPTLDVPADLNTLQFCAVWGGDVTGNGAMDLYFSNYKQNGGTTDVLMINDGTGNFTNETAARLGSYANVAFGTSVEIHDMDDDGDQDIVKISTLYGAAPFPIGQFLLFNNGAGVFDAVPFQELPSNRPYMFAVGDLDKNGLLDMYLQGDQLDGYILAQSATPDTVVAFDSSVLTNTPRTEQFGGNTKMADVDGDGYLDVGIAPIDVDIANCGTSQPFALLRNDGAGALSDPFPTDQNFHLDPHDFGFVDVNDDGCADLFMGLCTGWRVFIQSCAASVEAPLSAANVPLGDLVAGDLAALNDSDDDYLRVDAVLNGAGTRYIAAVLAVATSPVTTPSGLELTLESGADSAGSRSIVQLRNNNSGVWDTLQAFQQPVADTVQIVADLPNPADYVQPTGVIRVRLISIANVAALPDGYELRVDQIGIRVTP